MAIARTPWRDGAESDGGVTAESAACKARLWGPALLLTRLGASVLLVFDLATWTIMF